MRVFVTGGSGVLGTAMLPLLRREGHEAFAPSRDELNPFDPQAVGEAAGNAEAIVHLATSIPPPDRRAEPGAWAINDRLRAQASGLLVDAALASRTEVYVQPSVTFVYPREGNVDEDTPIGEVPETLRSVLVAEEEAARFTAAGRRGVVLRLGLLYGPGTESPEPNLEPYGAVLHVEDAGTALLAALEAPAGRYNVVADGGRVSNRRFRSDTGWAPRYGP